MLRHCKLFVGCLHVIIIEDQINKKKTNVLTVTSDNSVTYHYCGIILFCYEYCRNMNCILCNNIIRSTALIEIHLTFTSHSKTLLVNFIKKTLNYNLNNFGHSKYVCTDCYNIFEELDFTQLSCLRLRKQILDRCILKEYDSFLIDAGCQTADDQNESVFEKKDESLEELLQTTEKDSDDEVNNDDDYVQNDSDSVDSFQNLEVKAKKTKTRSIKIKVQNKKQSKSQECNECNKRFVSKNGLAIHVKRKHNKSKNDEPKFVEKRTRKSSRNTGKEKCSLEETGDDFEPETNDDSNNSDVPLNEVKKKTKKEKTIIIKASKYPCPQCPKMWRSKSDLKTHLVSHSEIRPFICEICGKAYKHKYALNVHVGMHNGINPFSCPHCKKSFTQKGALQRHIPIHTGEAPYQV